MMTWLIGLSVGLLAVLVLSFGVDWWLINRPRGNRSFTQFWRF